MKEKEKKEMLQLIEENERNIRFAKDYIKQDGDLIDQQQQEIEDLKRCIVYILDSIRLSGIHPKLKEKAETYAKSL